MHLNTLRTVGDGHLGTCIRCVTSVSRVRVQHYLPASDATRIQYYTYNTDYLIHLIFN